MKPRPNPWKPGDRVRVREDCPHTRMRGMTGVVLGASSVSLGIPNDYNTRVRLDDWRGSGQPIFHDASLQEDC